MSEINQYLFKFPSSKTFGIPSEKLVKKDKNSEISEISYYNQEFKEEEDSISQMDTSPINVKIGFKSKKNQSFHSKIENSKEKPRDFSRKYEEMKLEKYQRKIQLLEEENCNLQRLNSFSKVFIEDSEILRKKLESESKEIEKKNKIIEELRQEVFQMKEKYENNEYLLENKEMKKNSQMSTNDEKNENIEKTSPRTNLKMFELMNDNKNLSYVIKELSEKYNKNLMKTRVLESEKKALEVKLQEKTEENEEFIEKMQRLAVQSRPELSSKKISNKEVFSLLEELIKSNNNANKSEKKYSICSSHKKIAEKSINSEEKMNSDEIKEKILTTKLGELNPTSILKEIKNQKFKYSSKENFYLRKPDNSSALKLYAAHKKSSSKLNANY